MTSALSIGFHYHVPAELRQGCIYVPGYLGRFIDGLAQYSGHVHCFLHSPRDSQRPELDYRIESANVSLVDIGCHASVPYRMLHQDAFVAPIKKHLNDIDVMLIRGPSPLLPAVAQAASRLPVALLLVGSYVDGVDDLPQPRWRKELIRVWSKYNQRLQDRVAKDALVFVNSKKQYLYYKDRVDCLVETKTTTLRETDFYDGASRVPGATASLLYAGRYDLAKGLLEMVEAVRLLADAGTESRLNLVGWEEPGTGVIEQVMLLAHQLGVSDRILDHGRKAVGPELFSYYRAADVYLIASKANEGFPRTIWEAMANSLPVVASGLPSIRAFVEGAAVMVEPGSAASLADGILRVLNDRDLRLAMVSEGLRLARANTTEERSREMVAMLEQHVLTLRGAEQ